MLFALPRRLPRYLVAFVFAISLICSFQVRATHALGSDLHYVNAGPNLYFVTFRLFRDCSDTPGDPFYQLDYRGTTCGATGTGTAVGGSIPLIKLGITDGNPYCSRALSTMQPCDSTRSVSTPLPNFQIWAYSGIISLAPCSEWHLSVTASARPVLANISNSGNLYAEATLNNRDVIMMDDSSPAFSMADHLMPMFVMCDSSTLDFQIAAYDPDGDSLVLSLAPALAAAGIPCVYNAGYSATAPIRTLTAHPLTMSPGGRLRFQAGANSLNTSNGNAENKFVVVFQVDSYRRVNGQNLRISHVRREMVTRIVPCVSLPGAPPTVQPGNIEVMVAGRPTRYPNPGDVIFALPDELLQIRVAGQDLNGDSLRARVETNSIPDGARVNTYPGVLSNAPFMELIWDPTTAQVRPQPYVLHFTVRDNSCPFEASNNYTLPIQVVTQLPIGLNEDTDNHPLPAAPNPFTTEVRLNIKVNRANTASEVVIYDVTGRMVDRLPVAAGAGGERPLIWRPRPDLKSGLYLARYSDGTGTQTARLQKL